MAGMSHDLRRTFTEHPSQITCLKKLVNNGNFKDVIFQILNRIIAIQTSNLSLFNKNG